MRLIDPPASSLAQLDTRPALVTVERSPVEHLPITEVTVFKDGHAFVHREGNVAVNTGGTVVLDDLPAPVLGTFWTYAADPGIQLKTVVAGKKELPAQRPAKSMADLLEANKGKPVHIHEVDGRDYEGIIVDLPSPSGTDKDRIVLLKSHEQTRVVQLERIRDLSFPADPSTSVATAENRGVLTLQMTSMRAEPLLQTQVGMVYLQKGLRWIPNYKIEKDGQGKATIKLQATLINELADLKNARLQLVVGVPSFAFKDSLDPISLQETAAQLGQHFRQNAQTAFAFSNAIMSQSALFDPQQNASATGAPSGPSLGPDLPQGAKQEDLFIFTVEAVSLAKGERMVVPVAEYTVDYKDVYVLDLPLTPPVEAVRTLEGRNPQELENIRKMAAPKVMHKLRLTNSSGQPFTTAPALIVQNGRALGQGMMTYAAAGAATDLELTVAVDVRARKSDTETERVPNALDWNGSKLARVGLAGTISLGNHQDRPIDVEVVRHVLGHVDSVEAGGEAEQTNPREDGWQYAAVPEWLSWHSWPWWWHHVNGTGRIRWDVHLEPGQSVDLMYAWHYFWH